MKVFMLGWEFPPFISGGLGTACYGLTKAMSDVGTEVVFVLPRQIDASHSSHVKLVSPTKKILERVRTRQFRLEDFQHVRFHAVDTVMSPYQTDEGYQDAVEQYVQNHQRVHVTDSETHHESRVPAPSVASGNGSNYGRNLIDEVTRYARIAAEIATDEQFDVVHAHDWMTYPAGMAAAAVSGKPLVVHVHSTEFDRSGEHVNQRIYDIERRGMHAASRVIAVSYLTRNLVVGRYGVPAEKVEVVYNAIDVNGERKDTPLPTSIRGGNKIVLFLGRITMQKGPEYFLAAAKKVLQLEEDVVFVMAGSGDQITRTIERAAEMGIGHKVLFTGFLRGGDVARVFKMADLYVMPSVSEPFGLAPLEALCHDTPVLISKQSGVAEVLQHVLKVDFWDISEMANKIVAVLRHPPLRATLREHGSFEVRRFNWKDSARKCNEIYEAVV